MFGIPLNADNNVLDESLMPVLPKSLRHLSLPQDAFGAGNFDSAIKQRMLASIMCHSKSDRLLRDSSRWNGTPNVNPTSSKYSGPPGLRLQ